MVQLERVKELEKFDQQTTYGGVNTKLLVNTQTGETFVHETDLTAYNGSSKSVQDLNGKTIELDGDAFNYMEVNRKETSITVKAGQHTVRLSVVELDTNGDIVSFAIYFGVGSRPNDRKK